MKIIKLFLITLVILTSSCAKKEVVYKVDYDFNNVRFDQIKAIRYIGAPMVLRDVLFFYTQNLNNSLELINKDRESLIEILKSKGYLGNFNEEMVREFFTKSDILAFLFYNENTKIEDNNIMYRLVIAPSTRGDVIGLTKFKVEEDKMYPVDFVEDELDAMQDARVKVATFEEYTFYKLLGKNEEKVFKGPETIWKVVGKESKKVSGYIFDTYLVKSVDEEYKDFTFYVVNGINYLASTYIQPVNKINQVGEVIQISIPELGFYWDSDLPGKYYIDYKEVKAPAAKLSRAKFPSQFLPKWLY